MNLFGAVEMINFFYSILLCLKG